MEPLNILTFGGYKLSLGEQPVTALETRKADALLIYLCCNRRKHSREVLADMLWDERSQRQAMSNFRVVLTNLRKQLSPYLIINRETISLNFDAPIRCDATAFEEHLKRIHAAGGGKPVISAENARDIEQAVQLYQGEFLQGFYLRDSQEFSAWLDQERERFHRLAIDAMQMFVDFQLGSGQVQAGIEQCTRVLVLDPLNELAQQQMMQLLVWGGRRTEAIKQFEIFRKHLWDEFEVEPSQETTALLERIRSGSFALELPRQEKPAKTASDPFPNPDKTLGAFQERDEADSFRRDYLHIQVLGDFRLTYGEEKLTGLVLPRIQNLLVYLLLHRGAPVSRAHLAFLFWPDLPEGRTRNNLRQALHQLRQILPEADQFLETDTLTIFWRLNSPFWFDLAEFEKALSAADAAEQTGNQNVLYTALVRALALYQGDLLSSCYDDWITAERERLRQKYVSSLERLILLLDNKRDYPQAIRFAQQLVRHDPLHENGYRLLMRLYALHNDRTSALQIYQSCVDVLQRELGVEPEMVTQELYDHLLSADPPVAETTQGEQWKLPLVGRDDIWRQLLNIWSRIFVGGSHFVLLSGEAGIGKTRMGEEMLEWARRQGISHARTRSYAAEGHLSYDPIVGWLHSEVCQRAITQLEKLWLTELSRLLPELLIETPDLQPPEPLTEHWQRQKFFQAMARVILSVRQPVLLLIDDLQWCDPETLEWLHYLLRFDEKARMLVLGTVRIEEIPSNQALRVFLSDLHRQNLATELMLKPLDAAETSQLAAFVSGDQLDTNTASELFRETEGNPLFILETIRSGFLPNHLTPSVTSSDRLGNQSPMDNIEHLPSKVREVIAARLDQLSPQARELANIAAIIGRSFTLQVLIQACGASEVEVTRGLEELWQRRIIQELDINTYDFSHDRIRDVAYALISPPTRPLLHYRVVRAIETIHTDNLDPVSGQLAVHFEHAGMPDKAIHYFHLAAVVAQRFGANEEAILFLEKALDLLQGLPEGQARNRLELDLQMAMGASLVASRGYSAPEVIKIYDRARLLCQRLGQPPDPPILRALAIANVARAKFRKSLGFGTQLLKLARNQSSSFLEVEAQYALGVASFWLGAFEPAREHLAESVRLYQPDQSRTHIRLYSQDPKPVCLSRLAYVLWFLGYPSQARKTSQEGIEYAAELGHPLTSAYAMYHDAALYNHLQAFSKGEEKGQTLVSLANEHRLPFWLGMGYMVLGWSRAELGQIQEGIEQIREGIRIYRAAGAEHVYVFYLSLLAELYGRIGQVDAGLSLQSQALSIIEQSKECWCEGEMRLRLGKLFLEKNDAQGAEKAFQQAVEVARDQSGKMMELRAAVQLASLWSSQDRKSEIRQFLSPLCEWFGKGFDTPDLIAAQKLLYLNQSSA